MTKQSLFVISAMTLALFGLPDSSEARNLPPRLGSPAFLSDAGCFSKFGPTITNEFCAGETPWYVPIIIDGTGLGSLNVTVWAQGLSAGNTVRCRLWSTSRDGGGHLSSGFVALPFFGPSTTINLSVTVPIDGTLQLDCLLGQGAKVHTVLY
jgi:hypothetical protein